MVKVIISFSTVVEMKPEYYPNLLNPTPEEMMAQERKAFDDGDVCPEDYLSNGCKMTIKLVEVIEGEADAEIDNYLTENGFPTDGDNSLLDRVKDLVKSVQPPLSYRISHDAVVSRLLPHMAPGENHVSETLSRLLRYIQQLETTNAELKQGVIR